MAVINITEYEGWLDMRLWFYWIFGIVKDQIGVIDALQQEFRAQHPYVSAAIALVLIAVGAVIALPAMMAGMLAVVGFGAAGVIAGSAAAILQSIIYAGATTGLFSILQALGATMGAAPILFPLIVGLGIVAVGIWWWTS